MFRTIIILFILFAFSILGVFSQSTLKLPSMQLVNGEESTIPQRTVHFLDDGVLVSYSFNGINISNDPMFITAKRMHIMGLGNNCEQAEPDYPMRWDSFVIPNGKTAVVELLDSNFVIAPIEMSPAQPLLMQNSNNLDSINIVLPISPFSGYFPNSVCNNVSWNSYRGINILSVCICPIKYNYQSQDVQIFNSLTYKVHFSDIPNYTNEQSISFSPEDNFIFNTTINGSSELVKSEIAERTDSVEDFFIIAKVGYENPVEKLAEWKRKLGFRVHVIYSNCWTPNLIRDTLNYKLQTCENPYYLLFIGNNNIVPTEQHRMNTTHSSSFNYYTDGFYTPDSISIMSGRLPVGNVQEAEIIIDKLIYYERYPISDNLFYDKGLHLAVFQDNKNQQNQNIPDGYEDFWSTRASEMIRKVLVQKNKIINRYYVNTNTTVTPTHYNSRYGNYAEIPQDVVTLINNGSTTQDVINNINNGCYYILSILHGGPDGWWTIPFYEGDIPYLNNHNKPPIIFSMSCQTGTFLDDNNIAQRFLSYPNGGCIAFISPSADTHAAYTEALALGMFDAIWPDSSLVLKLKRSSIGELTTPIPTYRLGQILNQGLARMEEICEHTWLSYQKRIFHCLGDPSMFFPTCQPTPFENISITRTLSNVHVDTGTNYPTKISFYNKSTGDIKVKYGTQADYTTSENNIHNISVSVSYHNKIPFVEDPSELICLQNTTIHSNQTIAGAYVISGSQVTTNRPFGPVVFEGNNIEIKAESVEFQGETTISFGSTFEITNP